MELNEWKKKNSAARKYAHFDEKVSLNRIWSYISCPQNIKSHGFYPFIHYTKKFIKFKNGEIKEKTREICYSAHIDRYIYSYYGFLLNQNYNDYVMKHEINDVAVAYRDNLKKSNIHFAKQMFDFIRNSKECYVIIGDFTHFFDSLKHNYLKEQICKVMGVDRLPNDYFAVYKNITKYSKWELVSLLKLNGLKDTISGIVTLNSKERAISKQDFKNNKNIYVHKNDKDYGIPQGSAISAVLSNIYMIDCDEKISALVRQYNGLYMRYSDDFVVVLPKSNQNEFIMQFKEIYSIIKNIDNLILQPDKTQIYEYNNSIIKSCNSLVFNDVPDTNNIINYLGFIFDGNKITIRDKTVTKYYYRLYRKLKTIRKQKGYIKGKRISCKEVYEKYSIKGAHLKDSNGRVKGNFITYIHRVNEVFSEEEFTCTIPERHMFKIRKKLKKVFKS